MEEKQVQVGSEGITPAVAKDILEFISNHPVCGVVVATGGGKSTVIPKALYEQGVRVFISQPTIPAATLLYDYMKEQLGEAAVGFAAEGIVKYNANTKIIYCTSGHLRRKMMSYFKDGEIPSGDMTFCDVIMLDEAHNGTLDNDVIQELWSYAINKNVAVPVLVLASATMTRETTIFPQLPLYSIDLPKKPVEIIYHNKNYDPTDKALYVDTATMVLKYHNQNPLTEEQISKYMVFCAGQNEVDNVIAVLEAAQVPNLQILAAHSKLKKEEIDRIKIDPPLGTRQVIVATNIAEASITVKGLDGVFDTLTEKVAETSKSGGLRLVVKNISKSSANQRKGRTGRTNAGFCYRMCTEDFFEKLDEQRLAEIFRIPLTEVLLELLDAGIDPVVLFKERLSPKRIQKDMEVLRMLKMINKENKVIEAGKFASGFLLSVKAVSIIWEWLKLNKPDGTKYPIFPAVVTACLIDCFGPSYFFTPRKEYDQSIQDYKAYKDAYTDTYFKKFKGSSDLEVLINFWNDTLSQFETINPKKYLIKQWCNENSLNNSKVTELFTTIQRTCVKLLSMGYNIDVGLFNPKTVIKVLTPILKFSYGDSIYELRGGGNYINIKTGEYFKLDKNNSLTPELKNPYPKVVAFITAEIGGAVGAPSMRYISLSQPI